MGMKALGATQVAFVPLTELIPASQFVYAGVFGTHSPVFWNQNVSTRFSASSALGSGPVIGLAPT